MVARSRLVPMVVMFRSVGMDLNALTTLLLQGSYPAHPGGTLADHLKRRVDPTTHLKSQEDIFVPLTLFRGDCLKRQRRLQRGRRFLQEVIIHPRPDLRR